MIRPEQTGDEVVTWGEFIEARLLAQYRDEGALVAKMRPAVERLREELNTRYPLASAKTWPPRCWAHTTTTAGQAIRAASTLTA